MPRQQKNAHVARMDLWCTHLTSLGIHNNVFSKFVGLYDTILQV
jgi:hypothetical protein